MADDRRSLRALAKLLPTGVLGLSIGLAAAAQATSATGPNGSVAARLKAIRSSVSDVIHDAKQENADNPVELAWWGNGWHNGGWHNWGNGWGNGGWHNWGNGWHNWGNGWHNGWHNW